ncbi:hypothetical protein [Streptomyces sp. NPDC048508]|uniref:SbtR family transcriptional regulator n=1 Tax=Streptomyces sp. NPDC048508 TaxID=3365561 RepID=UPI00371C03A0
MTNADDPRAALLDWLNALTAYATSARGRADALLQCRTADEDHVNTCSARVRGAVDPLLHGAARAGAVTSDAPPPT